jgi:uncharacterized protein (TIGR02246 family)
MNASDTNQVLFSKKLSTGSKKLGAGVLSQIRWHLTRWQPILLGLVLGLLGWQSGLSIGYAANELAAPKATEQNIKQHSGAFAKAYNAGDAAAIAHLFTAKGEFIDVQRTVYQGPAAIEEEFVASFQTAPGSMIEIQVDSIRQVAAGVTMEDGQVTVQSQGDGPVYVSRYAAVHVYEKGQWKLASLRDLSGEASSPGEHLVDLKWLVGDWIAETADSAVEHHFGWSEDGNFILGEFSVRTDGQQVMDGTQRIGWDPLAKQIRSWIFDSEGGYLESEWTEFEDGWMVRISGVRPDGATGSATNYYLPEDDDKIVWKSTQRVVGGEREENIEVVLVRMPPAPKQGSK